MARLTPEQIKEAVRRQRPGYKVVGEQTETDAARQRGAAPDAVSPDLEQMQRNYEPDAERRARGNPAGNGDGPSKSEDTMVTIGPEDAGTDRVGAGPKQVILDSTGKIVAEQG